MFKFRQRNSTEENISAIELIAKCTGLQFAAARILWQRGITTEEEACAFLKPDLNQVHDPFMLPDMDISVRRIKKAVAEGEIVTVFCDYDADGTCGGSALYLHLKSLGLHVDIMTPNRHKEGYGLNETAIRQADENDSTLIITVDCGITNIEEVEYAKKSGIDVIITDHHECGETLPGTPYIINPKRKDSIYPYESLAGCGVAFKLIEALSGIEAAMQHIDLVAIGTVTDIVPLLGENRALVHLGIEKLKTKPCAGAEALSRIAGIKMNSSLGVSYGLGPRINAAGRMETAKLALDILSAIEPSQELDEKVKQICRLNNQRRKEVDEITLSAAETVIKKEYMNDNAILLADEGWNTGVIGIAAAKISEKFSRPCILFGGAEGSLVGSARSIEGINMYEVLSEFSDSFEKFGGHAQAAGLTIRPALLDELRQKVCAAIAKKYDESVFVQQKDYDLELDADNITDKLITDIDRLEPFGHCNPKPLFLIKNAKVSSAKMIGKENGSHLKFIMSSDGSTGVDAMNFFFKENYSYLPGRGDFLCEAELNDYSGKPQLIVRQLKMRFDDTLKNSYIDANKAQMARQFLDEVSSLDRAVEEQTEKEFESSILNQMTKSLFSMCISAGTVPSFERLLSINAVKEALNSGRLKLYDRNDYHSDNCIYVEPAPGHRNIFVIGTGGFFDEKLLKSYKSYAEEFFAQRNELLNMYKQTEKLLAEEPKTVSQITKMLGFGFEKTAFALRVYSELKLIEVQKSGKIAATNFGGTRRDLIESKCFRGFADLMEKVL